MATIVATLIAFPLAHVTTRNLDEDQQAAVSLQRSAKLLLKLGEDFFRYLTGTGKRLLEDLKAKLTLFIDPNYKKRSRTAQMRMNQLLPKELEKYRSPMT